MRCLTPFAVLACIALSGLHTAAACELQPQAVCEANGAGIHCHPCLAASYTECCSPAQGTVQSCPEGLLWDAFSSQCVPASSKPSPCVAGVNINLPPASLRASYTAVDSSGNVNSQLASPQQSQQQSWVDWAASSISSLISSATAATAEITKAVPAVLSALLPLYTAGYTSASLRSQMLGLPTVQHLQQMQANLARAADMHSHAVSMSQDATLAESVAAKDLAAAKALLLRPAGSSSNAAAVAEAKQLIKQAAAALETAENMRYTSDDLMSLSAAEAAGVSVAFTAATQQQQRRSSSDITVQLATEDDGAEDGYDTDVDEPMMQYPEPLDSAIHIPDEDYYYLEDGDVTYDDIYSHDDNEDNNPTTSQDKKLSTAAEEKAALLAQVEELQTPRLTGNWVGGDDSDNTLPQTVVPGSSSSSSDEFVDLFDNEDIQDPSSSSVSKMTPATANLEFQDPQLLLDLENALLQIEQDQQQQQQQGSWSSSAPTGMMAPEVAQRWQQRSRKGLSGRLQIRPITVAADRR